MARQPGSTNALFGAAFGLNSFREFALCTVDGHTGAVTIARQLKEKNHTISPRVQPAPPMPIPAAVTQVVIRLLSDAREFISRNPGRADHCLEQASELLHSSNPRPCQSSSAGGLASWQLRAVRNHINANLARQLPIAELAALARLSPSYFARAFKKSEGLTPRAFINQQRIERAKELMLTSGASIDEIARCCGLGDQARLTRLFGSFEAESPTAWRCQYRVPGEK